MKKRFFALTMSLLLLLSLLPLSAGAAGISFTDVPKDHYAYSAISYVCDKGLMNGVGKNRFDPESSFTRAMFVTILGRMEGIDPARYTGAPFSDVSTTKQSIAWAAPYIQWAAENGIVNGVGHGKFDPDGIITREQYCTILLRYFNTVKVDTNGAAPASVWLSDGYDISDYAVAGVRTMVGFGLIDLYPDRAFLPQHQLNRAEIAQSFAMAHQFLTKGYIPGVLSSQSWPVQDYNDILYALRDSVQHEWDWYVDCSFTDRSQTVQGDQTVYPNWDHEKVIAPGVRSLFDLNALSYDYFAPKAVNSLREYKGFIEKNGSLYISATEGLGGFMVDDCAIDVNQIEDTVYEVTLIEYSGGETVNTQTVNYYFAENNRWVFSLPLPVDLQYVPMAFG